MRVKSICTFITAKIVLRILEAVAHYVQATTGGMPFSKESLYVNDHSCNAQQAVQYVAGMFACTFSDF